MYCSQCGKELLPEQKFCPGCGQAVGNDTPPNASCETASPAKEEPHSADPQSQAAEKALDYEKYRPRVKKMLTLEIISNALCLIFFLLLLFLPIFQAKYPLSTPSTLLEYQFGDVSARDLSSLVSDGCLYKEFSIFDEFVTMWKVFFNDYKPDIMGRFPWFLISYSLIVVSLIMEISDSISDFFGIAKKFREIDKTLLFEYGQPFDALKGDFKEKRIKSTKPRFWWFLGLLAIAFFILYISNVSSSSIDVSHLFLHTGHLCGLSTSFAVSAVLFAAMFIYSIVVVRAEFSLHREILRDSETPAQ